MRDPGKEVVVLFPLNLNVHLHFALENIEGLGQTKLTVSLRARPIQLLSF